MERLLELLNAYAEVCNSNFGYAGYDPELRAFEVLNDGKVSYLWDETITSLRFWFIDYLFDKQIINIKKCKKDEDYKTLVKYYEPEDAALMVLATRYSNIDLLISWLEND